MNTHWSEALAGCLIGVLLLLGTPRLAAAVNAVVDVQVAGSESDASETSSGVVTLAGSSLDLGGSHRKVGLRFTNVNIPRNAAITRAYIEFTAAAPDATATKITFEIQASDSAPAFADTAFNLHSRPTYSQSVEWTIDFPWVTVDQVHQSAELKDLVQKVVSRSGWAANNAIAFIATGTEDVFRRAKAWDLEPAKAPRLHVEYTANVVEVRIDRSVDDVYQQYYSPMSATVYNTDTFYFGNSSYLYPGLRFRNVDVPEGAVINYACIRFTAKQAHAAEGGYVRFYGEKRLNAAEFSTSGSATTAPYYRKVNASVPKTTTYVQWSGFGEWAADREYSSADLKAIVQELVGISGWGASDKTMVFLMNPGGGTLNRYARSYDYAANAAPVLHIEYGQAAGGGGSGPAVMTVGNTELGRSCFQGAAAENQYFTLINSGASTLSYSSSVTYKSGSNWIGLSPGAGIGSLGPGEAQDYTVAFNTAGLPVGTYEAVITLYDPSAAVTTVELKVGLTILRQDTLQCGDVPLYTQSISSPTVMILLDSSGSMADKVDIYDGNTMRPQTPNLKPIVQEVVNRDGWAPGNAMVFLFEHLSGSGRRYARSYDGFTLSAARLHIDYTDAGLDKSISVQINKSTDDGEATGGCMWSSSTPQVTLAANGNGMGGAFRFENITIPKKAVIRNAYLEFVPYMTETTQIAVTIYGEASDNPPTFGQFDCVTPELLNRVKTSAGVRWDIPPWTGVTLDTRISVAKAVISELVKDTSISWGFGTWTTDAAGYVPENDYTIIHVGCNAHTTEHQARLQAAISATESRSSTPFSRSLIAGKNYFKGTRADEFGSYFVEAACQPKFVIKVTDGMGNIDSTLQNTVERAQALADAGVTTVAIGFGLSEVDAAQLYALADVANRRGEAATGDTLYAMHTRDESGKALPYLTFDKEGLIAALRTVTNSIKGAVFYGSAPAATTSTDLGDMVLVSSFDAGNWTGDVRAITKTSDGAWQAQAWKASEHIPAARSAWTTTSGGQMVAYTADTLSGDNYLCKPIGDIINSTPLVVGAPPFFYTFDDYGVFKRRYAADPRDRMVYVGSNDGLLHAFRLEDGVEKWAFLPRSLHERLNLAASAETYNPCSGAYCHQPTLDGSPTVADVYADGTRKWRTMLVIGQRQGGTAYTALDVTSGQSPAGGNPDPAAFLWELNDADMGESWSDPAIERVGYPESGPSAAVWAAFMSSGYHANDNLQPTKLAYLYGLEAYSGAPLWKADGVDTNKIQVDDETGWQLAYHSYAGAAPDGNDRVKVSQNNQDVCSVKVKKVMAHTSGANTTGGYGTLLLESDPAACGFIANKSFQLFPKGATALADGPATLSGQRNNALSSPVTGSFDHPDHVEDCIYVGDLYGSMFRVDGIGKGQTPSVSKLFKFSPYPATPDRTPIRGKASIAYSEGNAGLWVYYGTGRYESTADKTSTGQQYFFGLKDSATPRAVPYAPADLTSLEARFASASIGATSKPVRTIGGTNPAAAPWALKLFAGQSGWGGPSPAGASERVFTKPLVVGGIVFFTSFIPDADQCTGSGDTWVFALDYKTGLPPAKPVFDVNGDGKFTEADKVDVNGAKAMPVGVYVGRGQGSAPVLFKDTLFVTTSTAQVQAQATGSGTVTGLNALKVNIPQKKIRLESWKHE
jgi:hypothetical protein